MEERASVINFRGVEYELVLTTRATKEIAKKFGGLEKMGEIIEKSSDGIEKAIEDVVWIVCLLANQGTARHNIEYPEDKRELLTEEMLELFTEPSDFNNFRSAIVSALMKGTNREFPGDTEKN